MFLDVLNVLHDFRMVLARRAADREAQKSARTTLCSAGRPGSVRLPLHENLRCVIERLVRLGRSGSTPPGSQHRRFSRTVVGGTRRTCAATTGQRGHGGERCVPMSVLMRCGRSRRSGIVRLCSSLSWRWPGRVCRPRAYRLAIWYRAARGLAAGERARWRVLSSLGGVKNG